MGRKKGPRRDEALRQYVKSNGEMTVSQIATFLGVTPNTVRTWRREDKWDEVLALPPEERKLPTHIGPPFGSKNALGNKGGKGGPYGNKNAVGRRAGKCGTNNQITGEYSQIYLETLTPEEKKIFWGIREDPMEIISHNIRLLMIRERRMLANLESLKQQKEVVETEEHVVLRKGDVPTSPSVREITKRKRLLIDKIIACEDAITRVQEQLMKTLERQQKMLADAQEKDNGVTNNITFSFKR